MMGVFAEYDRGVIRERDAAGAGRGLGVATQQRVSFLSWITTNV